MKNLIVFTFLLLFGFTACDPLINGSDSSDSNKTGLDEIKTYKSMYQSIDGATEYKAYEWDSNLLYSYDFDGNIVRTTTYDDRGRKTQYQRTPQFGEQPQIIYRYEGNGTSNDESTFDRQYLTSTEPEYLFMEWKGDVRFTYQTDGTVVGTTTYDDKRRITQLELLSLWGDGLAIIYRYEGDGTSNIASNFDKKYKKTVGVEHLEYEWNGDTLLSYSEDGNVRSFETYDDKGRLSQSEGANITIYRYID